MGNTKVQLKEGRGLNKLPRCQTSSICRRFILAFRRNAVLSRVAERTVLARLRGNKFITKGMKRSYRESSGALYAPRRTWKELIRVYGLGIALIALLGLLVMIYSGIFSSHQEHEKIAERISSLTSTTNYPEEEEDDEVKDLNLPIAEGQVMHVLVGGKQPGYAFLLVSAS